MRNFFGIRPLQSLLPYAYLRVKTLDLLQSAENQHDPDQFDPDLHTQAPDLDSAEILDPRATTELRAARESLEEELEEARRNNDIGRLPLLQAMLDSVIGELHSAHRPDGRRRRRDAEHLQKDSDRAHVDNARVEGRRRGRQTADGKRRRRRRRCARSL